MFQRSQLQTLLARLGEPARFIQILTGPRQVGKTTLVRQAESQLKPGRLLYAAADLPASPTSDWITQQWQRALLATSSEASGLPPYVLVLDEIQKIPRWSETIKGLWDARPPNLQLVLLGSSQFLMQQGLTESLAGRFEIIRLPHWSFAEMQQAFGYSLEDYLRFGGYPGPAELIGQSDRWLRYVQDSIIEPTVSRDVLGLARIDKPSLMRRLMHLGCIYSGQILSYQKMIGQLQDAGNTTTLAHYLHLLSAAWMVTGLDKYAGDQARSRASSPKFQVFDTALQAGLLGEDPGTLKANPELWGRLTESAVGAHLLNTSAPSTKIEYWRDRNKEVDFVAHTPSTLLAIEVKSGRQSRVADGLAEFKRQFPQARALRIGTGGVPLKELLKVPAPQWLDAAIGRDA